MVPVPVHNDCARVIDTRWHYFDADLDPNFYFDADPDPDPTPSFTDVEKSEFFYHSSASLQYIVLSFSSA